MTLSTLSVVQQISQETEHRDNISNESRSTSKNSRQAQEFNISDVIVKQSESQNSELKARCLSSECNASLIIVKLGLQNSQFRQWFWNILEYLQLPIGPTDSGLQISGTLILSSKMLPSRQILLNCHQKCRQARHLAYSVAVKDEFHVEI